MFQVCSREARWAKGMEEIEQHKQYQEMKVESEQTADHIGSFRSWIRLWFLLWEKYRDFKGFWVKGKQLDLYFKGNINVLSETSLDRAKERRVEPD